MNILSYKYIEECTQQRDSIIKLKCIYHYVDDPVVITMGDRLRDPGFG